MFRSTLLALAILVSPAAAWAQTVQPTQNSRPSEAFVAWIERVMAIQTEANNALSAIQDSSALLAPGPDRAAALRQSQLLRAKSTEVRSALARTRSALEAHGPYTGETPSNELRQVADALYNDMKKYVTDVDALLVTVIDLTHAIERNDVSAGRRLIPKLQNSARISLDGQILAVRGRQRMFSSDEADYHSLGALAAVYTGMRALAFNEGGPTRDGVRIAAASAIEWARSGRVALQKERTSVSQYRPQDRALLTQLLDLDEKGFVIVDQMAASLNAAANDSQASGLGSPKILEYMFELSRLEIAYQQIATEQFNLSLKAVQ
jgi:hypothetical protein